MQCQLVRKFPGDDYLQELMQPAQKNILANHPVQFLTLKIVDVVVSK